jgi:amino acid permease
MEGTIEKADSGLNSFVEGEGPPPPFVEVDEPPRGKSSILRAIFNVFCAGAGAGIIGLPFALRLTSWYGVILLALGAAVCIYTGYLMSRVFNDHKELMNYNDFGKMALGKTGLFLVAFCQIGVCYGTDILFLVLASQNLFKVFHFSPLNQKHWTLICTALVLPLCYLKSFHEVGLIAIFGAIATLMVVIVVIIEIARMPLSSVRSYGEVEFGGVLRGFSMMVFAYGAHSVFPGIQRAMKKPSRFGHAVMAAFLAMLVLYIVTAVIGYWAFGVNTHDNVLNNLENGVATIIIRVALTAHVLFAYVLYAQANFEMADPLVRKLYAKCFKTKDETPDLNVSPQTDDVKADVKQPTADVPPDASIATEAHDKEKKTKTSSSFYNRFSRGFAWIPPYGYILFIRTLLVLLSMLLAMYIPNFGALMSLIGAATVAATIFMMPAGFYVKMYWTRVSLFEKIICFAIVILGTAAAVIGCVFAIKDMVHSS